MYKHKEDSYTLSPIELRFLLCVVYRYQLIDVLFVLNFLFFLKSELVLKIYEKID